MDTLSSIERVWRSPTVRWIVGVVATVVASVYGYAQSWQQSVATDEELRELEARLVARLNDHDHGTDEDLPRRHDELGREIVVVHPDLEDRIRALEESWRTQHGKLAAADRSQERAMLELMRWAVRVSAASAEPRRARRQYVARRAEARFDRLLRQGVDPVEAMRRVLEPRPPY
ncbi:MAG: hypothetical protein GWN84_20645 [Gammaproteobacteria bacterium]|nr:hypothetical protein [Gammaproteobacteria bacterium]NIR85171.1 hypothetical protein [Gammaproteobacteria bacterium]NIU06220.1 hypothetical protein [Gammaproteobacteria bacterium]NIX87493.1 hypothetical protein [Gammaproteobacteria bacterium]